MTPLPADSHNSKKAIDNALDALEEAGVLPDIYLGIFMMEGDIFVVEDNGLA